MQDVQESQNTNQPISGGVQPQVVEADQPPAEGLRSSAPPKPGVPAPEGFYYRLVGRKGHKEWKLYKKPDGRRPEAQRADTRKMREAKQSKVQQQPVEAFDRDKYLQEMRQSQESSNKQILDQLVQLNSYWSQFQNQQQKPLQAKPSGDAQEVKEDAEKSQEVKKVVKKAVKKPVEQEPPTAEALGRGPQQEEIEEQQENGEFEYNQPMASAGGEAPPPQRQRGNPQLQSHPLFKRNRY